jgi:CP family cyanate transporter-like MFS transporter
MKGTPVPGIPLVDSDPADDAAATAHVPERRLPLILLGASLILIALNLRAAVAGIGPVLREIARSLELSAPAISVFTSLPTLLFGLFAPVAPVLSRRIGTERALLAALVLLTLGCAMRGLGTLPTLFAGQIVAMAAIGVLNVLMPGLIKRDFPNRIGLMTGLYTTAFCVGAAGAAALSVPIALAFGGNWGPALGVWAVPAALAVLVWAVQLRRHAGDGGDRGSHVPGMWRDGVAWQLLLFMGLQSALAYVVFSWLPAMLRDRGLSEVDAGLMLSVSAAAQGLACLAVPALAIRGRDQRLVTVLSVASCLLGLIGCFYLPLWAIWFWSVFLGLAQGALIAIALTLIVLRSASPQVTAGLSGMTQCGGYLLSSGGPLLAGFLHERAGGWTGVFVLCVALCAAAAVTGYGASRDRLVRAETQPGR